MHVQTLDFVILILSYIHQLSAEHSKCNALLGLSKYVRPHAASRLVLNFNITLRDLVFDQKGTIFDVLRFLRVRDGLSS